MRVATRLTLGIVAVVVLTAALGGFLAYSGFRSAMIAEGKVQLRSQTALVADHLGDYVAGARADVLTLRQSPLVEALVRADRAGGVDPVSARRASDLREDLAGVFLAHMRNEPAYLQIRLIGLRDGGREIVRVDRADVGLPSRRVPEMELQQKGERPYFLAALPLADGEVYISPLQLNQEHGGIQRPFVPVLRSATPVTAPGGQPFGVVIINIGMRPVLSEIRQENAALGSIFLTDTAGNFLLNPDSTLEFGSEFGMPGEFLRRFPALGPFLRCDTTVLLDDVTLEGSQYALAVSPQRLAGGPKVLVIQRVSHDRLLAFAGPLRDVSLFAGLIAVILSAAVAFLLGRRLAGPIVAITRAARSFTGTSPINTGVRDSGEIGDLAAAIEQMTTQVCTTTGTLNREIEERGRAEERFRLVVESSPSGMIMVNERGDITLVNAEAERMFGYTRGTLLGQSVDLLLPGRFRTGHPWSRAQFHANPQKRSMGAGRELFALRRNGSEFPVEIGLTPVQSPDGLFVLSVIIDITFRKEAEQAARRYTEILERTNRDLEEFTSIASHDLQEPLRKITSFGDRLLSEYSARLDPTGQGYLDRLVRSADRMRSLVTSLLEYSRSGRMREAPVAVDLNRTVQDAIADLEAVITEKSAHVQSADLPIIEANAVQMRQLFQNLIGNALKFHKHGEAPDITVRTGPTPDHRLGEHPKCRIVVEDRGIGFDQAYAERIFSPFERLHGQSEYEGTGMGLAICRRIVEKHGGSLSADGIPGTGARFTIVLPVKQSDQGGSNETQHADHHTHGG